MTVEPRCRFLSFSERPAFLSPGRKGALFLSVLLSLIFPAIICQKGPLLGPLNGGPQNEILFPGSMGSAPLIMSDFNVIKIIIYNLLGL